MPAKANERADTLGKLPGFADALDAAELTPGHVDAITSKAKPLTDSQRAEYFERVAGLVDVASAATVEEFRKRLAIEARATERDDGIERLERQRRKTALRVWTDSEGMWRFDGRFDPLRAPSSTPGSKPPCKPCSPNRHPTPARPIRCSSSSTCGR